MNQSPISDNVTPALGRRSKQVAQDLTEPSTMLSARASLWRWCGRGAGCRLADQGRGRRIVLDDLLYDVRHEVAVLARRCRSSAGCRLSGQARGRRRIVLDDLLYDVRHEVAVLAHRR